MEPSHHWQSWHDLEMNNAHPDNQSYSYSCEAMHAQIGNGLMHSSIITMCTTHADTHPCAQQGWHLTLKWKIKSDRGQCQSVCGV